jgi:hypothetical protein
VVYPEKGIAALVATLSAAPAAHRAQRVASPFDWPKLMAGATHIFPLFSEHAQLGPLPTAPTANAVSTAAAGSGRTAVSATPGGRHGIRAAHQQRQPQQDVAEVQSAVAEVVASVLGTAVDPMQPLMEAGLDSIGVPPSCYADIQPQADDRTVGHRTIWRNVLLNTSDKASGVATCWGAQ